MKNKIILMALIAFVSILGITIILWHYRLAVLQRLNVSNPMLLAFLVSFEVQNDSGEEIDIISIGMISPTGKYGPLPRYQNVYPPAVPIDRREIVRLQPRASSKITYDYDDINFRHILIRDKIGAFYILDTDKKGTKDSCYGPQKNLYIIPAIQNLKAVPKELIQCFDGRDVFYEDAKEYPEEASTVPALPPSQ